MNLPINGIASKVSDNQRMLGSLYIAPAKNIEILDSQQDLEVVCGWVCVHLFLRFICYLFIQLKRTCEKQLEEMRRLKQQIVLKDRRIRELEEQLACLKSASHEKPAASQ